RSDHGRHPQARRRRHPLARRLLVDARDAEHAACRPALPRGGARGAPLLLACGHRHRFRAPGRRCLALPAPGGPRADRHVDEDGRVAARLCRGRGRLVVTYLSALTDENQRVGLGGYPAVLRELLGITVSELLPLAPEETVHLEDGSRASEWVERVRLADASALTSYRDGPVAGRPAVTSVARGRGTAVSLSARFVQE